MKLKKGDKTMAPATQEKLISLTPEQIYVGPNVRFRVKPFRVERLAEQITEANGVNTPIEVSQLSTPIDGKKYQLTTGLHRLEAVTKLNSQGAGLSLPARVVTVASDLERLRRQISENQERENMSPMDKAVAIQALVSAGLSKMDIRKIFAVPGGRKGVKIQPASNSHINMHLSFLDLPKTIQEKIDDGRVPISAAQELVKAAPDDRAAILEKAEALRLKAIEEDEKQDEAFLAAEKKAAEDALAAEEQKKKAEKEALALAEAKATAESATKVAKEKADEVVAALKDTMKKGLSKEDKAKAKEHYKAVQNELKSAEDASEKALAVAAKLEEKANKAAEKAAERAKAAAERKAKVDAARAEKAAQKAATAPQKAVTAADVKAAASGAVPLNASQMRGFVNDLMLPGGHESVRMLGKILSGVFAGTLTDKQGFTQINKLFK